MPASCCAAAVADAATMASAVSIVPAYHLIRVTFMGFLFPRAATARTT
jgi:hypothetical protein